MDTMSQGESQSTDNIQQTQQRIKTKYRGFAFCNKNGCTYCKLLNKTSSITSPSTGIRHNTMIKVLCRNSNLIYAISCKWCCMQYVGQISETEMHIWTHRDTIKCLQDKPKDVYIGPNSTWFVKNGNHEWEKGHTVWKKS